METFRKNSSNAGHANTGLVTGTLTGHEMNGLENSEVPESLVTDGFFVKQGEMMVKVVYDDIMWVEAGGNYSHIHLIGKQPPITVVHHLGRVEEYLPRHMFTRINKSEIVNLHLVDRFCGNLIYINKRSFVVAENCRNYVFSCFKVLIRKK